MAKNKPKYTTKQNIVTKYYIKQNIAINSVKTLKMVQIKKKKNLKIFLKISKAEKLIMVNWRDEAKFIKIN